MWKEELEVIAPLKFDIHIANLAPIIGFSK